MGTVSAKQILSNFYGLMMELNLHRADEDVLKELQVNPDPQIEKHLIKIKQLNAKLKAKTNASRFQNATEQFRTLKEKGIEEFKKLIKPQEEAQLMPLFRKFEEITEEDQASILDDQELLKLMEILNNRANDNSEQ